MSGTKYPFGPADILPLTATGAQAVAIANDCVILDAVTTQVTGNITINLTIPTTGYVLKAGAKLFLKVNTVGTQTTTFGTGFTAPTITGVAGKTFTQTFIFDGTNYLPQGAALQIN